MKHTFFVRHKRDATWCNSLSAIFLPLFFTAIMFHNGFSQGLSDNLTIVNAEVSKEKIGDNQLLVTYHHNNDREISPYEVNYQYIQKNYQDHIELPAKSFLQDLDMYFDKGVSIEAIGNDQVSIDNDLVEGQVLDPASANYNVRKGDISLLQYQIGLNDRRVIGTEIIEIENQNYSAFIIQSTLIVNKILNSGSELNASSEVIQDWFVADHGIIKRRRLSSSSTNEEMISEVRFN